MLTDSVILIAVTTPALTDRLHELQAALEKLVARRVRVDAEIADVQKKIAAYECVLGEILANAEGATPSDSGESGNAYARGSAAEAVRAVLPTMPEKFTVADVEAAVVSQWPGMSPGAIQTAVGRAAASGALVVVQVRQGRSKAIYKRASAMEGESVPGPQNNWLTGSIRQPA